MWWSGEERSGQAGGMKRISEMERRRMKKIYRRKVEQVSRRRYESNMRIYRWKGVPGR